VTLQPVPLGVEQGVVQPVELTNSGGVEAPWRVDLSTIASHNAENYNFEVLSVTPLEGTLMPQSSTFLHFTFRPLEAKRYVCRVRVEMLKDGHPAEELCFEVQADGYMPLDVAPQVEPQFPQNLPIQTYAPVPGGGAALSIEILDFKQVPLRARHMQMLVLVNYTSDFVLSFRWDARKLFRSEHELEIEPSQGELSPGSHCIVVFRLCCEEPIDVSGEVACYLDWTHISAYGQQSITESYEDSQEQVEYFAFHAEHIHEPAWSGKGAKAPVHISVANRLTVSRFRHLMSTAAGQKFLNQNLHRTSMLSSHIPVMSPRQARQASTMGLALQSREDATQSSSSMDESSRGAQAPVAPTSHPLYVRVRAVVADWAVPVDQKNDFLVESPAQNLLARRRIEGRETQAKPLSGPGVCGVEDDATEVQDQTPRSPAPTSGPPTDPQGFQRGVSANLMHGVLEHMMREVIADEEFSFILDKMLSQEVPFFMQYEDSQPPALPLPDHPAAPEPSLMPRSLEEQPQTEQPADDGTDEDDDLQTEFVAAASSGSSAVPWSDLLMDFQAPQSCLSGKRSSEGQTADVTAKSPGRSRHGSDDHEDAGTEPTTPATPDAARGRSWEEAQSHFGQVDLDAFQNSAGEVLDQMLMDMMDDVISGRLNWMRPLPRVKSDRRL